MTFNTFNPFSAFNSGSSSPGDEPTFALPLTDNGSGAVNVLIDRGTGTATFTRATAAWTKLSTGLWASVASGVARSCYLGNSTAVGTYGGYLAETAGTQLVTPTASIRGMDDASWVKVNVTAAKTATGIDGVVNSASRVTATANAGTILQTLVAAASTRTYSLFIRRVTGTGTITISQGATTLDVTSSLNASTYTRVQLAASVLNAAFGITFGTDTDAIDVDFNQFEAGAIATSPLDAAGAVRNADLLNYPAAGNVGMTAGTIYAEIGYFATAHGNSSVQIQIDDATNNERYAIFKDAAATSESNIVTDGAVVQVNQTVAAVFTVGVVSKVAMSYEVNLFDLCGNGTLATQDTLGTLPTVTTISIGSTTVGAAQLNGCIKNVRLWQTRLAPVYLQNMTS